MRRKDLISGIRCRSVPVFPFLAKSTWSMVCAAMVVAFLLSGTGCKDEERGNDNNNNNYNEQTKCEVEGEVVCSEDAYAIERCQGGYWQRTECMRDFGQLCEDGECVDPWRYGSPEWDRCTDDPLATPESLHQKMVYYEAIARRLHIHPELKWLSEVVLKCLEVTCQGGETPPCYDCTQPAVPEDQATCNDVEQWNTGENDGLWSSLYLAAEAYRYGATGDSEALDTIRVLLEGEETRMKITGVPGIFTRQMIPPGVEGISCPTDPAAYIPDEEKDDNKWVMIGAEGCANVVDPVSMEWVITDHCGLDEFAGWCFLDNVSQDEYSGHMIALGAVAKLVDDPGIQATTQDLLTQVCQHLIDNELEFIDWDGRRTEHGWIWPPYALGGWMAAISLSFMKTCVEATQNPVFIDYYDNCMLKKGGERDCIDGSADADEPYTDLLSELLLYLGAGNCRSNWNNFSMHMLSLHGLIWHERDPMYRVLVQRSLDQDVFNPVDEDKPLIEQNNAFFDFIYAADKELGPGTDGQAFDVVRNGVCMLRQFPASYHVPTLECPTEKCVATCEDRHGNPMTDYARPAAERCPATFLWWQSPYSVTGCTEDLRRIRPPTSYLLPYWMGRYYGFITGDM